MDDIDLNFSDSSSISAAAPAPAAATAASSRFQPKSKGKPMTKISAPKPEPAAIKEPHPPPIKDQEPLSTIQKRKEPSIDDDIANGGDGDIGEEEDVVVDEFDVFFSSSLADEENPLYVMQYPLRTKWRPYELDERCEEVRVKTKQSEVEIDLRLDIESENYDADAVESGLRKQTLKSSTEASTSNLAIGLVVGKQVHLNPIDAVLQLRPSKMFSNASLQEKHIIPSKTSNLKRAEGKEVPGDSTKTAAVEEPWIPLEYQSMESFWSKNYQKRMVTDKRLNIPCEPNLSYYVNSLCPGTSTNKKAGVGPSRKILLSMPLEERLMKWFSEGPQVNRFVSILYLAPDHPIEDVLKALQQHAYLVQGLWVSKSSLLYEGVRATARDYIVYQFTKNCVIRYDKKRPPPDFVKPLLAPLAVQRSLLKDWKFKEPSDLSFANSYPDVVSEQECAWSDRMEQLMNSVGGAGQTKDKSRVIDELMKSLNPHLLEKNVNSVKVEHAQVSNNGRT